MDDSDHAVPTIEEAREIDRVCEALERAWRRGIAASDCRLPGRAGRETRVPYLVQSY